MSLIKNIRSYPSKKSDALTCFVMCGFGGSIWQVKRLITVLNRGGYDVTAFDFSATVLNAGDPNLLPELVQEVTELAEKTARETAEPILLVGISLGALISLNIMRRSAYFNRGVFITGGDIVKVAHRMYKSKWPQSYDDLAKLWKSVNMYTDPADLASKRLFFVLPRRDKLIDPEDVRQEAALQNQAGNNLTLIERHAFGHVGTIIEETILFPKRTLRYIAHLSEK